MVSSLHRLTFLYLVELISFFIRVFYKTFQRRKEIPPILCFVESANNHLALGSIEVKKGFCPILLCIGNKVLLIYINQLKYSFWDCD